MSTVTVGESLLTILHRQCRQESRVGLGISQEYIAISLCERSGEVSQNARPGIIERMQLMLSFDTPLMTETLSCRL